MKIITNRHECVDLGLPSGTLWAKTNVGAMEETETGFYFAWGETKGYAASQVGTDKEFSLSDYVFSRPDADPFDKYDHDKDGLTKLELTDDAARVNWGGDWHMPTKTQCEELFNTAYVKNKWVTNYQGSGVNGLLFTSVSNGNTLFIPAAGFCDGDEVYDVGEGCYIWSSSLSTDVSISVWDFGFGFYDRGAGVSDGGYRCCGQSVRGVISM